MAKKKETKKEMEATNDFVEVKTPSVIEQPKQKIVAEKPLPKKITGRLKIECTI